MNLAAEIPGISPNATASSEDLWRSIRQEAQTVLTSDPIFGRSLSAAILDHADFHSAVAQQIGERLGKTTTERAQFTEIAREAFLAAPDLIEAARRDRRGIAPHDPAAPELLPALLNFKGFIALQAYRVSNWLWSNKRTDFALLLQSEAADSLQVSVHPSAQIGTSVFQDHATGIILGAFVRIGDEVTIMQNVTVGRTDPRERRAPSIGRGVLLSTGARLLGDIRIGDSAKIGAGAVVAIDVPAGCTAIGVPARLINCQKDAVSA